MDFLFGGFGISAFSTADAAFSQFGFSTKLNSTASSPQFLAWLKAIVAAIVTQLLLLNFLCPAEPVSCFASHSSLGSVCVWGYLKF